MSVNKYLFIRNIRSNELATTMRQAKQRHPELEIIFVIINRKGDPAYGIRVTSTSFSRS